MKNIIIPGFATSEEIYSDFTRKFKIQISKIKSEEATDNFIKNIKDEIILIPLKTYKYEEVNNYIKSILYNEEKINLLGWSLGSLFSLKWTIENPQNVFSLFLIGATPRFCENNNYVNGIKKESVMKMLRLMRLKKNAVLNDFYNNIFEYCDKKEEYKKLLLNKNYPEEYLCNGLEELLNFDLLGEINKIKIPVEIHHGVFDKTTPLYGAKIIEREIKRSKLYTYEGGHALLCENPSLISEKWGDFLCSLKK